MRLQHRKRHRRQPLHRPLQQAAPQARRILRQPGQISSRSTNKDLLPLPVPPQTSIYPRAGGTWPDETRDSGVGARRSTLYLG